MNNRLTTSSQPPPPPWLDHDLQTLHDRYLDDDLTAHMRPYLIDPAQPTRALTTLPGNAGRLEPGQRAPPSATDPTKDCKLQYQPRIRCNDCTGKWYNVRRGKVVDDFEVHLRNRGHMENVRARLAATGGGAGSGNA